MKEIILEIEHANAYLKAMFKSGNANEHDCANVRMHLDNIECLVKKLNLADVSLEERSDSAVCVCKKPKRHIYGVRECEKCGKPLPKAH